MRGSDTPWVFGLEYNTTMAGRTAAAIENSNGMQVPGGSAFNPAFVIEGHGKAMQIH